MDDNGATGVIEAGPSVSALDAVIYSYRACMGDMQATAERLGWPLHQLEGLMDMVYARMSEKAQDEDYRAVLHGQALMEAGAAVSFSVHKARTSERSGHRWMQVGVLWSKHRSELADLNLARDTSAVPPTVIVVGAIPDAMPIRALADGKFEKVTQVIDAVEAAE